MSESKGTADIGLIGLAVMGENLVLNFESRGLEVAVFNRTTSKVDSFVEGRAKGKKIVGTRTPSELCAALKTPRVIMMMVKAGGAVDATIASVLPFLEKGDILIDGGNSNFNDTTRRVAELAEKGFLFCGAGVSGGEEGALKGPSIMPGGNKAAWATVGPLLQAVSAKVFGTKDGKQDAKGGEADVPCCDWVGSGGAGHFVKTVHNGIEYGDIQLICEAYQILKQLTGVSNEELHAIFKEWNTGDLDSYLIEITRDIFGKKEEDGKSYVVDNILDTAGQKGTGKWTAITALDLGKPVTLIGEAVFARCLSAQKDERVAASKVLEGPNAGKYEGKKEELITAVRDALFASKIVSYAQGFVLIKAASDEYKWNIDYGAVALMWRGGCIIRSKFLQEIKIAFDKDPNLANLLMSDFFHSKIKAAQANWRKVAGLCVTYGIPCPAMMCALSYYDGYRTARLPANLLQAQRDYFGAHQYERLDKARGQFFHTNWTGRGGTTASNTYNA